MDLYRVTLMDVNDMLTEFRLVLSEPRERQNEPVADVWFRVLEGCDRRDLQGATDAYLRQGKHWPRPSEILALVQSQHDGRKPSGPQSLTQQHLAWQQRDLSDGDPCPVCGSCLEWPASQGRVRLVHDDQRHREAGIGYVNIGVAA